VQKSDTYHATTLTACQRCERNATLVMKYGPDADWEAWEDMCANVKGACPPTFRAAVLGICLSGISSRAIGEHEYLLPGKSLAGDEAKPQKDGGYGSPEPGLGKAPPMDPT
jgi:hypothetical protein